MAQCARLAAERRNRSRGRDETRADRLAVLDVDRPGRGLFVAALASPDHTPPDEVLDELPDDVPVGAQDGVVELRIAQELEGAAQPVSLSERRRLDDRDFQLPCQRLHSLHAAQIWARVDRRDLERLHDIDERLGLLGALLADGAKAVVALPVAAASGFGVADEIEGGHAYGIHLRRLLRSIAFQAFGHCARAASVARCSMAISCPATNARRLFTRAARSQACALPPS